MAFRWPRETSSARERRTKPPERPAGRRKKNRRLSGRRARGGSTNFYRQGIRGRDPSEGRRRDHRGPKTMDRSDASRGAWTFSRAPVPDQGRARDLGRSRDPGCRRLGRDDRLWHRRPPAPPRRGSLTKQPSRDYFSSSFAFSSSRNFFLAARKIFFPSVEIFFPDVAPSTTFISVSRITTRG